MDLTHIRTENDITTLVTARAALNEINAGMMGDTKRLVRQMSAARSSANIEYRDGRKVQIRPATAEEIAEHTRPQNTSAITLAEELGIPTGAIIDAASDLAIEWKDRGHRAVFRSLVTADADLSAEAARELRLRLAKAEPAREYRTLKGAKVGDTITLWQRGNSKGPIGEPTTVTIAEIRGGWYVNRADGNGQCFLGGTGSKYWVISA